MCAICYALSRAVAAQQEDSDDDEDGRLCALCNGAAPQPGSQFCQSCYAVQIQSLQQRPSRDGGRAMPWQADANEARGDFLLALLPTRPFLGDADALKREGAAEAAVREVLEETGVETEVPSSLIYACIMPLRACSCCATS